VTWHTFDPSADVAGILSRHYLGDRWSLSLTDSALVLEELHRCYEFIAAATEGQLVDERHAPNVAAERHLLKQSNVVMENSLREIDQVSGALTEIVGRINSALHSVRKEIRDK
jgi:hypothetical protein